MSHRHRLRGFNKGGLKPTLRTSPTFAGGDRLDIAQIAGGNYLMKTSTSLLLLLAAVATAYAAEPTTEISRQDKQPNGDHLLTDGEFVAVVGASPRPHLDFYGFPTTNAYGSILDFRPRGTGSDDGLTIGSPVLAFESRLIYPVHSSVEMADDGTAIHAVATGTLDDPQRPFKISTTYGLRPGAGIIDVRSRLLNTGTEKLEGVRFSLHDEAKRYYGYGPYVTSLHQKFRFQVVPRPGSLLGWVDLNPRDEDGDPLRVSLAPGEAHEIRYALTVDNDSGGLLATIYRLLDVEAVPLVIRFEDLDPGLHEVVIRDTAGGSVFFRTFRNDPSPLTVTLPPGTYTVTGNFFPAVAETVLTVGREATECTLENPAQGRVRVVVRNETGDPVPGKLTFIGLHPTPSPYFQPHDPIKSGRAWERFKNSVFPALADLELELPVGRYLATASRGPEHTLDQKVVEVFADQPTDLRFLVERVVDTEGMVAIDAHMHTLKSDGSVTEEERVISLIAEGIEVAVATDHFFANNYAPAVEATGLTDWLRVMIGSEISIRNPLDYEYTLDFTVYPLGPGEGGWSATETLVEEVAPIFEATRERYPDALIQINHPRRGTWDYLVNYELDPDSAATAREGFWTGFDVLEVLNGPSLRTSNNSETVNDWLNLLARGFFFPATASSDSHRIDTDEPGYSRTYVYVRDRDLKTVDIGAVVDSLRKGRSFVTNGPIVELTVNDKHLPGDTLSAVEGEVEIHIEVRAASWISVDEVKVIVNRRIAYALPVEAAPGSVQRLRRDLRLELANDAFVVVEVTGKGSLYPVVQSRSWSGLQADAVSPYALTNPVFVDVDGNGRFDPPLPKIIRSLPPVTE